MKATNRHSLSKQKWLEDNLAYLYGNGGVADSPAVTQVFASNATGILIIGTQGTGSIGGRTARYANGPYTPMAMFRCYGRKLTMGVLPYGADLTIRVDGVAQTIARNDSTWSDVVVFDNETDDWHEIEQAPGGAINYLEMDNANYLTLESGSPDIRYPSTVSNPIYAAYVASYIVNDGTQSNVGGENYSSDLYQSGWLRFRATTSQIRVLAFGNSSVVALYQDGVLLGRTQLDSSGVNKWYTLTASDGSTEHEYWVSTSNVTDASGVPATNKLYVNRISSAGMSTSAITAKTKIVWVGDSITWGYGIVSSYQDLCFATQVSISKSRAFANFAIGGKTLLQAITDGIVATANAQSPDQVVCNYGHNDVVGSTTDDDFRNAVYDLLHGLCGGTATKIYYPGIFPYTGSGAKLATFNGYISAIIGGAADALGRSLTAPEQAKCVYLDPSSWFTPATDTTDGTHLNVTGHVKVTTQLVAAIT
ncbi:MAG TPA: SGNH/GDSL hydrolase family protein [Gemmatales bacterium]|nr:SGNH/GDSL hydrolase family protein [Gemmatales bacterium]